MYYLARVPFRSAVSAPGPAPPGARRFRFRLPDDERAERERNNVESSYRVEFSCSPSRPFAFYYLQPYGVPIASRAPSLSPAAALELPPAPPLRASSLTSTLH